MAERKRKVPGPDGREVDATVLSFNPSAEYWTEVLVDDGTVIKLKLVVTDVYRVDGAYDADDNPVYVVRSTNIVRVDPPESLRRGKS